MRIGIVAYDGFDELDALGPYEVLRTAAREGAPAAVSLVSDVPAAHVTGSHGLTVAPQASLDDGAFDLVVVPGGGWNDRAAAGAYAEARRGALPSRLRALHLAGAAVASVCTGAMLLAAAGLVRGRRCTTHRLTLDDLRAEGAELVERASSTTVSC